MRVNDKVILALLEQYLDIAINSIHGATVYVRKLPNAVVRVETNKESILFETPMGVSCYSLKDISGFSIVDVDRKEIIFGIRYEINDTKWIITSTSM